ncbi:regulatory protein RecX [Agromyces silvae]|uniref:regulatory protein RecX n=1 Tax=Agromyces silvae TaxID=3388266 RepID=UPI00280B056F|nr:regulatory protein RecX [Agromyces protaetiae]
MRDTSRGGETEHLAPVSYLPWAIPGVDRGGDASARRSARPAAEVDSDREVDAEVDAEADADRWNEASDDDSCERLQRQYPARRGTHPARTGSGRPVAHLDGRAETADPAEPGVERDARIDRLVIGRLRRSSLSVAEVRDVLTEHGLDEAEVDEWIERYERLGYLNDVRLAEQLVRTGAERRGRGSGAILAELTRRGVSAEATRAALEALDPDLERNTALAVAERRARQLGGLDRQVAERRLTAFLQRRGYDGAVVREAVAAALSTHGS